MTRIRNSALLSTLGVLAAGGVFAFALYSFYPSSDEDISVPVIKAEAEPIRIEPVQVGGMDIPFQDTTVYDSMRSAESTAGQRIENLLEPAAQEPVEEPMTKEEVVAAVEKQISELESAEEKVAVISEDVKPSSDVEPSLAELEEDISVAKNELEEMKQKVIQSSELIAVPIETEKKPLRNILDEEKVAVQADAQSASPKEPISEAGTSPETLAFVRSVLDKKDTEEVLKAAPTESGTATRVTTAQKVEVQPQAIEPAAGVQHEIVTSGSSYVQLASITDKSRAGSEWTKLKEKFSAIPSSSDFRVEEANLEKGTFFRIQAGPYSETQAKSICESIKSVQAGGCLVVK